MLEMSIYFAIELSLTEIYFVVFVHALICAPNIYLTRKSEANPRIFPSWNVYNRGKQFQISEINRKQLYSQKLQHNNSSY